MMHLVFYDISTDAIRNKIAKRLIAEGYERIQLSVFVGVLHPRQNKTLWQTLKGNLKAEPSARFYVVKISDNNFRQMSTIGKSKLDIAFLLGEKNTIFI